MHERRKSNIKEKEMDIIKKIQLENMKAEPPKFSVGDTVKVHVRVIEGKKERIQIFEGIVLKKQNGGVGETFTVRKISSGFGVERTFLIHSPKIEKVDIVRRGKVRRAKLNYLRDRVGKSAKVKEKRA
jgi:large subunit ribosomal protein L19